MSRKQRAKASSLLFVIVLSFCTCWQLDRRLLTWYWHVVSTVRVNNEGNSTTEFFRGKQWCRRWCYRYECSSEWHKQNHLYTQFSVKWTCASSIFSFRLADTSILSFFPHFPLQNEFQIKYTEFSWTDEPLDMAKISIWLLKRWISLFNFPVAVIEQTLAHSHRSKYYDCCSTVASCVRFSVSIQWRPSMINRDGVNGTDGNRQWQTQKHLRPSRNRKKKREKFTRN